MNTVILVRFIISAFANHPDCQIDNSSFNRPIMACYSVLKSLYTGGNPEQGFLNCFADGLNQSLFSAMAQATF